MANKINTGETWFVRLPGGTSLVEAKVIEVTNKTVLLNTGETWNKGSRYVKSEIKFIEIVITT